MTDEKRNLFWRLLFVSVVGITAAKLSPFTRPLTIPAPCFIITLSMGRFDIGVFLEKASGLMAGFFTGLVITELLVPTHYLEVILVYAIFFTALKLFSHRYRPVTVFLFVFSFMYSSIFGSYQESNFELEVLQSLWQLIWVFFIVGSAFILFPGQTPGKKEKPLDVSWIPNWQIGVFSAMLTGVWIFNMMFEWRFAYGAYLYLIALFMDFTLERMKGKAIENLKIRTLACVLGAMFSLAMYGIIENIFLMFLGILILYFPLIHRFVYSEDPRETSKSMGLIMGMMTPLTLYVNLNGAAVYRCLVRAVTIGILMLLVIFVIGLMEEGEREAFRKV